MSGVGELKLIQSGSIERESLFGLLAVGATIAVAAWLVLSAIAVMGTISKGLQYNEQLLTAIQTLQAHLVDVETGERGYIITGDERYLEPYHTALQELDAHRQKLAEVVDGTPLKIVLLPELSGHIERKLEISRSNVAARSQGFEAARKHLIEAGGKREMDAVRHLLDAQAKMAESEVSRLWIRRHQALSDLLRNLTLAALLLSGALLYIHFRLRREMRQRREIEKRIAHLASHDTLTGLPNRRLLMEHLELALSRARRNGREIGLLFLDLNGFKLINDQHGHEAGDEVLKAAATRLSLLMRDSDLVARLGGDEFVMFLDDVTDREGICRVVGKINEALCQPIVLKNGIEVAVTTSIGVAVYPGDGETGEALLSHADAAMYESKRTRSNCFCKKQGRLRGCVVGGERI